MHTQHTCILHIVCFFTAPNLVAQLSPLLITGDSRRDPIGLLCTPSVTEDVTLASYQFTWFKDRFPLDIVVYMDRVSVYAIVHLCNSFHAVI